MAASRALSREAHSRQRCRRSAHRRLPRYPRTRSPPQRGPLHRRRHRRPARAGACPRRRGRLFGRERARARKPCRRRRRYPRRACPDDVPIHVAPRAVMDAIAGFPMHRGVLALGKAGGHRRRVRTSRADCRHRRSSYSGRPSRTTTIWARSSAMRRSSGPMPPSSTRSRATRSIASPSECPSGASSKCPSAAGATSRPTWRQLPGAASN